MSRMRTKLSTAPLHVLRGVASTLPAPLYDSIYAKKVKEDPDYDESLSTDGAWTISSRKSSYGHRYNIKCNGMSVPVKVCGVSYLTYNPNSFKDSKSGEAKETNDLRIPVCDSVPRRYPGTEEQKVMLQALIDESFSKTSADLSRTIEALNSYGRANLGYAPGADDECFTNFNCINPLTVKVGEVSDTPPSYNIKAVFCTEWEPPVKLDAKIVTDLTIKLRGQPPTTYTGKMTRKEFGEAVTGRVFYTTALGHVRCFRGNSGAVNFSFKTTDVVLIEIPLKAVKSKSEIAEDLARTQRSAFTLGIGDDCDDCDLSDEDDY